MPEAEFNYDLFISYADADRGWVEGYLLDALTPADLPQDRTHPNARPDLTEQRM